jgi:uncharacterized protein (TIGR03067 family)
MQHGSIETDLINPCYLVEGEMIRTFYCASLLLTLSAIVAADEKSDADAAARKSLTGVWRGFAVDGKGEKPDQGPVKLELTISEKTIKGIEFKGETPVDHGEGAFTLDLAADPQQLDGTKTNERGRKDTWLGIYKLEKDTLYWCVAKRERPETFATVKGQFLMILKRAEK